MHSMIRPIIFLIILFSGCKQTNDFVKHPVTNTPYSLDQEGCHLVNFHRSCLSIFDYSLNSDCYIEPNYVEYHELDHDKINNAKEDIISKSKSYNTLVINENHLNPAHRIFAESLLLDLKNQGYSKLFLETLTANDEKDKQINKHKVPTLESGFYSIEPRFGNFLRKALMLGFEVLSYESHDHNSADEREHNQANYIYQKMLESKDEKCIVYCGYDHGIEFNNKIESMCSYLTKFLKEDILSIDQTSNAFLGSNNVGPITYSNIKSSGYDINVLHPQLKREAWTNYSSELKSYKVNYPKDIEEPYYILAKKPMETDLHVALDALKIDRKGEATLILPSGNYDLIYLDSSNSWVHNISIND